MKKAIAALCVFGFGIMLIVIAAQDEDILKETKTRQINVVSDSVAAEDKEPEEAFSFIDVEGNLFEAELLADVPLNDYNPNQLMEEDGYKYYCSEKGNRISKLGVDVSRYQTDVNWQKIQEAGAEFAIIRVGFRGYAEPGNLVLDEMYNSHIEGALEAGLEVGVYFFSQAVIDAEALEEAEFVLAQIQDYDITLPVVFDTEEIKNDEARTDHIAKEQFTANCIVFCERIAEAGYTPMIYANMKWMAFTLELEKLVKYQKWYADYESFPQCPYQFTMWQYTESGTIPGIEGNADLNIWFLTE